MYNVDANLGKKRVEVTSEGAHDHDMDEFVEKVKEAALHVLKQHDHFDILTDLSQAITLQQDRTQATTDLLEWCHKNGLRKSANVVGTLVQKMQINRISGQSEKVASFTSKAEAERWLDEE
ncbi:MAG: hypothetical protein AAGK17_11925 [Pseudomonadota bacterium]